MAIQTENVSARVPAVTRETLSLIAKEMGLTESGFLRMAIDDAIGKYIHLVTAICVMCERKTAPVALKSGTKFICPDCVADRSADVTPAE